MKHGLYLQDDFYMDVGFKVRLNLYFFAMFVFFIATDCINEPIIALLTQCFQ